MLCYVDVEDGKVDFPEAPRHGVVLAQDGEERRAVKIPKLATSDTTHANMPRGKMEGDVRGLQCYSAEQQRQASRRD